MASCSLWHMSRQATQGHEQRGDLGLAVCAVSGGQGADPEDERGGLL